ncbi:MAG: hypothetical protein K8R46_03810 [Pirellulales bacterium]|nr:hypothetical protein [Pirellulales bacterium]
MLRRLERIPTRRYTGRMIGLVRGLQDGIRGLRRAGLGLLFPPRCVHCDADLFNALSGPCLCAECLARCGPEQWHGCPRCGALVSDEHYSSDDCPGCSKVQLWFDTVVALGGYRAGLRNAVLCMKRPSHDPLSLALGRLLWERRRDRLSEIRADVVIPVPMYWSRRLHRGKNNPEALAGCLARSLGVSMLRGVLVRQLNTKPQAGLSSFRRFQNVRGAFRVRRPDGIRDARILLIDDVLTTGATCSEAAKTLKQAGAAMVAVAVVARA